MKDYTVQLQIKAANCTVVIRCQDVFLKILYLWGPFLELLGWSHHWNVSGWIWVVVAILSLPRLDSDQGFFLGTFLSPSPWGFAGLSFSFGTRVCRHPCLSLPRQLRRSAGTEARVSFFVCLSGCSHPRPPVAPPFPLPSSSLMSSLG